MEDIQVETEDLDDFAEENVFLVVELWAILSRLPLLLESNEFFQEIYRHKGLVVLVFEDTHARLRLLDQEAIRQV